MSSNKKRRQSNPARKKEIPELLARLRRINPDHLQWVMDPLDDGGAPIFDEIVHIAAAGAGLIAPLELIDAATEIAEQAGRLYRQAAAAAETTPDRDVWRQAAGQVDAVAALCLSAENAGGPLSAVWGWLGSFGAALIAYLSDPNAAEVELVGAPAARALRVVLMRLDGNDRAALWPCKMHLSEISRLCAGPLGTIMLPAVLPLVDELDDTAAISIIAGRTEPFIGAPETLLNLALERPIATGRHDILDATWRAFERWAEWGAQVRRSALLPSAHPDSYNTKLWETLATVTRAFAASYHHSHDDHARFESTLDGWDHVYAEYLRLADELGTVHTTIALPAEPSEREQLFEQLRGNRQQIETMFRQMRTLRKSRRVAPQDLGRVAYLAAAAAAADGDPNAALRIVTELDVEWMSFDHNVGWWFMHINAQLPGAPPLIGLLVASAPLRDPRRTPHDVVDRIAELSGLDPAAVRADAAPSIERLRAAADANPQDVALLATLLVSERLADDIVTGAFVAPLIVETINPLHEAPLVPPELAASFGRDRARDVLAATLIVAAAAELVAVTEPEAALAETVQLADLDDSDEDEAARGERRRRREERRAARRRQPGPEGGTGDDETEVETDSLDSVEATIVDAVGHRDRKLALHVCERLEALTVEGVDVTTTAESWVEQLSGAPLREVLGETDADLELLRALQLARRPGAAAGVAVALFWRAVNSGGDPGDFYTAAVELGADTGTLATMSDALSSDTDDTDDDTDVRVVFVGGREEQAKCAAQIDVELAERYGGRVTVTWIHPYWTTNTAAVAAKTAAALSRADVLVLMRLMPTTLGEMLRRLASDAGKPWVACTGHGRASMTRAVETAARVARTTVRS